jgi:hypothetical protein
MGMYGVLYFLKQFGFENKEGGSYSAVFLEEETVYIQKGKKRV